MNQFFAGLSLSCVFLVLIINAGSWRDKSPDDIKDKNIAAGGHLHEFFARFSTFPSTSTRKSMISFHSEVFIVNGNDNKRILLALS